MPRRTKSVPVYRKHRASGQAIVTLDGQDHYLGPHGSLASHAEYDRLIAEWLANGRRTVHRDGENSGISANDLVLRYWRHVEKYYVKGGKATSEQSNIHQVLRWLTRLYGGSMAADFGPLALKAIRQAMISAGRARTTTNRDIGRLKQVFRWGVENELVPADVYQGLLAISGLKRGRSEARETEPVRPVDDSLVEPIKPHVAPQVWAMIELQRLTGMRSGEMVIMRACDIDMSGKVWLYRPETHKTEHHGHQRIVELGPRAQTVIRPFLKTDTAAFLFSPSQGEAEQRAKRHRERKTPLNQGNRPGTNRKTNPQRRPMERYSRDSYRRAIERGIERAFPHPELSKVPKAKRTNEQRQELKRWYRQYHWHPHQLRHSFATGIRKQYGLETARILLGQSTLAAAEIYAEAERSRAAEIMFNIG